MDNCREEEEEEKVEFGGVSSAVIFSLTDGGDIKDQSLSLFCRRCAF